MLKIIQVETDEHKSHIQEVFWEYFHETNLIFRKEAQALYHVFGFQDIEPYLEKTEIPLEHRANWVFMELILK
ncbi:MAG: hypothetical protein V7K41_06050 [Nostoc sp.]|uniref:hypothetical protein n=1 Tax=Nostoc sp. TaxID=1180 RepID=UPI002FF48DC7